MRHRDTFIPQLHGTDQDGCTRGADPGAPPAQVRAADLSRLPTTVASVEQRLANLTAAQRARVQAVLTGTDIEALDPAEVIDLCDRISGRITFAEYQARGRLQRSAARGR